MKLNKAAMFGLDARIALAIFGALSVISGAALYSAIQNSRATALVAELNELGKAWEQFYLDTGVYPSRLNTTASHDDYHIFKTVDLKVSPGFTGWQGPYLSFADDGNFLYHPSHYAMQIMQLRNDETWSNWNSGTCTTGFICSIWVYINGIEDESLVRAIDEMIDGGDGASAGSIRYFTGPSPYYTRIHYKYVATKNPHD